MLTVGLGSALIGWLGAGTWQDGRHGEELRSGTIAVAVVVDVRPSEGTPVRTAADLVVRISNLGRAPITLLGEEAALDAGSILGVAPARLTVAPGGGELAVLHTAVACASPQPLRLPDLRFRDADQRLRPVPVEGASQSLGRICDLLWGTVHQLDLVQVSQDGDQLRLRLRSPVGRSTQILGISARGVPLPGQPIPGAVEAGERAIWLARPTICPPEWLAAGFPRTLDIQVDNGGRQSVTVDVGFALTRWLRSGACSGNDR